MLQMQIAQKMCERRVLKHKADVADAYHTKTCRQCYIKATHEHKNKSKDEKNHENIKKQAKKKEKKKWRMNQEGGEKKEQREKKMRRGGRKRGEEMRRKGGNKEQLPF